MSFNFEWPTFSEAFYADAREMLAQALNKGPKPPIIADRIEVTELNMGTLPPELEILEIGDLSTDRFRGIFRLTYAGDAHIALQTKVQANPLNVPRPSLDILDSPRILFAAASLDVPMTLRLSSLSLRAIVVLVVSRQKGITLVFKNDPLESVNVSSSFDGVDSVAGYIQREIEGQLREAFRSDLPSIIHRLSQKWLSGEVKSATEGPGFRGQKKGEGGFEKDARIETRTAYVPGEKEKRGGRGFTRKIMNPSVAESVSIAPSEVDTSFGHESIVDLNGGSLGGNSRRASLGRNSSRRSSTSAAPLRDDSKQSVSESIESYDPTYGLRPDSIPQHAGFGEYERLVRLGVEGRGFGGILGITEEEEEGVMGHEYDDSFDVIGLADLVDDGSGARVPDWDASPNQRRTSLSTSHFDTHQSPQYDYDPSAEFETIPAVGGGTITRPRIFHTQSQMRTRTASSGSLSAHGSPSTATARGRGVDGEGSSASTIGAQSTGSRPPAYAPVGDPRLEYFYQSAAAMGAGSRSAAGSGTSTPRFPFPKYGHRSTSSFATTSTPSLLRNSYSGPAQRRSHPLSQFSSSVNSTSPENTRRSAHRSNYSSPPSSLPSPPLQHKSPSPASPSSSPDSTDPPFPFPRPDPIDLLSRSPSSVNNNSFDGDLPITLNPSASDSCAHLATLTSSNQTLSPFTRAHEHFTARSSPHVISRAGSTMGLSGSRGLSFLGRSGAEVGKSNSEADGTTTNVQVAKRKRVHRIGSAKVVPNSNSSPASLAGDFQRMRVRDSGVMMGSRGRSPAPSEFGEYFPSIKGAIKRAGAVLDADAF